MSNNFLVRFNDANGLTTSVNVCTKSSDGYQILCLAVARCGSSFDPSKASRQGNLAEFKDKAGNLARIERLL